MFELLLQKVSVKRVLLLTTVFQTGIGHSGISESMEKIKNKTNVASMAIVSMLKKKPMINSMSDVETSQW